MSFNPAMTIVALLLLKQRNVPQDKAIAASVGAGILPSPFGLALPLVVAGQAGSAPSGPGASRDEVVEVPNVVDRTEDDAARVLEKSGLQLGSISELFTTSDRAPGHVVQQKPAAGDLARIESSVSVVVTRLRVEPEPSDDCSRTPRRRHRHPPRGETSTPGLKEAGDD
jgi:hypothetical protein